MGYTEHDRITQARKSRIAHREPYPVRKPNWEYSGERPRCTIHQLEAIWHKNKARESGGQWVCKNCQRDKSRGQRRVWKTDHTDPMRYNFARMLAAAKMTCKLHGREYTVTVDDVISLWHLQSGKCAITDEDMSYIPGNGERKRHKVTIDRIDSSRGYSRDNIWLVCDWVNRAKTDMSINEMTKFATGILSRISSNRFHSPAAEHNLK